MVSIYLYFLVSIAFFYLFIYFVHVYKKNKKEHFFNYAVVFLFIFLVCFFNSVPLLATNNLQIAAYGNVISNIFLYCLIFSCFRVQIVATDYFFKNNISLLNIGLFVISIISTAFQLIYLDPPKISFLGVAWSLNSITSMLLILTTFAYGIYWGIVFGKIAHILKETFLKRRMYMISINGILLGIAGLFLFQNDMNMTIIGIIMLLVSVISTCIIFLIPERSLKSASNPITR